MADVIAPSGSVATVSDELAETLVARGWSFVACRPDAEKPQPDEPDDKDATEEVEEAAVEPVEPEKRKPGRPKKSE